jgi:uncharacterized membrane protein HdeD (DUF308 family)
MGTQKTLSWLVAIVGLWELLAAFVLGYSATSAAMWNAVIIGLALMILGIWAAVSEEKTTDKTLDWVNLLLGIWLIISPFVLGYMSVSAALWNDVIVGLAVVVLTAWGVYALGHQTPHIASPKTS